jgi:hypothetical protein
MLGGMIGIAGLILATISVIRAIQKWKMMKVNPELPRIKSQLILALSIDAIYALLIIVLFVAVIWIFIGYSNGL